MGAHDTPAGDPTRVLIVGGYGHVGSRLARELTHDTRIAVTIAGRTLSKAQQLAAQLKCKAAAIDLSNAKGWGPAVDDADLVVVCLDQDNASFAAHVLRRRKTYVDITASDVLFKQIEALQNLAVEHQGQAVLSVGLAPGLTNLMAAACLEKLDETRKVRIGIMLGLGDEHGDAAIDWTFQNLLSAQSSRLAQIGFGSPPKTYPAIPFDFADQHVIRRRHDIPDTLTYLSLVPATTGRALFGMIPILRKFPFFSRWVRKIIPHLRFGSDRAALSVEAHGLMQGDPTTVRATLEGRKEADITAVVAAFIVATLARRPVQPGVHHIDDIVTYADLLPCLSQNNLDTVLTVSKA